MTGMGNYEVAKYLLTQFFLDHSEWKMILIWQGMNVVRMDQSGTPLQRRISFCDQIHTTGMDIHQCIDARAVLTLGKDMTS